jgi:hypothetical protein
MFIFDKAFAYRSFFSHTTLANKVAAGIVIGAALIAVVGMAYPPAEGPNSLDTEAIKLMSARQLSGNPSRLIFLETDPAWYAKGSSAKAALGISPQESKDIEASMVNGHIQAF